MKRGEHARSNLDILGEQADKLVIIHIIITCFINYPHFPIAINTDVISKTSQNLIILYLIAPLIKYNIPKEPTYAASKLDAEPIFFRGSLDEQC